MIPDASPELIQQLLYRFKIQAYLTYAVHCIHLIASSKREIPVNGRSELIKTRTRVKINCLKHVIFRNDPLSIHWRTS